MSAQRETEFDITLKIYPNGRASGYLDRVQLGEAISVFGMGNKRRAPDPPSVGSGSGCYIGIVGFGVGITEALPVAAAELARAGESKVTLLWQSRTWADTFWHDDVAALEAAHPGRFRKLPATAPLRLFLRLFLLLFFQHPAEQCMHRTLPRPLAPRF